MLLRPVFDPTNNLLVDTDHITLAWGRDYSDVAPVRGHTAAGTVMVKDIYAGSAWDYYTYSYAPYSSDPQHLTNVNGKLFFVSDDGMASWPSTWLPACWRTTSTWTATR